MLLWRIDMWSLTKALLNLFALTFLLGVGSLFVYVTWEVFFKWNH
jgi:hypothetical protein